jgi:hypothetical protein
MQRLGATRCSRPAELVGLFERVCTDQKIRNHFGELKVLGLSTSK